MEYLYHIIILISIYSILSLAANIPVGLVNLISLGQAAFYGIGAYISAFLLFRFNISIFLILPAVIFLTSLTSLIVSFAAIRLKGDYFILATLGFQLIIYAILQNWNNVTHGSQGVSDIPSPVLIPGVPINTNLEYAFLALALTICTALVFLLVQSSPFGRVLRAIRCDELGVLTSGRNVNRFKITAFLLSAGLTAIGGFLLAGYVKYIDPPTFTLDESLFILSALFIGGIGNVKGCVIGAAFIIILPELLRYIGLPLAIAANVKQIVYGLCLLGVAFYRPKGLAGATILT